jgi:DNA-directed RNA polymerase specialized sigma24 family protein
MATRVSDQNAFFSQNYPEISIIVANAVRRHFRDDLLGFSVEDLFQEGLICAHNALRFIDLDKGWHQYVKTVVDRTLSRHVENLKRHFPELAVGSADAADSMATLPIDDCDLATMPTVCSEIEHVKRRAAGRRAIEALRERLSPAARCVLDLTIRPPLALLIMARNEEGRPVRPQQRHLARFAGMPYRQVERAHVEIWQKSHRVAA